MPPTENFENLDSLRLNLRAFLMILKIGFLSTPVQCCLPASSIYVYNSCDHILINAVAMLAS